MARDTLTFLLINIVNFFPTSSGTILSLYSLWFTSRNSQSSIVKHQSSLIAPAMSQDPFRDPNGSQTSSSIGNRSSHAESTAPQEKIVVNSPRKSVPLSKLATGGMGGIPPPQALLPTPTQGSNHHRQEPSRYTSQNQIDAIDHITPIPRIGQVNSQRSSYGGGTSSGDESTSSGLSERRPIPEPLDRRPEKVKSGHRWIVTTKWIFITTLIGMK